MVVLDPCAVDIKGTDSTVWVSIRVGCNLGIGGKAVQQMKCSPMVSFVKCGDCHVQMDVLQEISE